MNSRPISMRLRQVLADVFDIPIGEVTPDLSAGSISSWDSAGHLEAILAIEAEFGVQFDPEKMGDLTTVALLQAELDSMGVRAR